MTYSDISHHVTEGSPTDFQTDEQITIHSFEPADSMACRELFADGMWQLTNPTVRITLPRFITHAQWVGAIAVVASLKFYLWIIPLYIVLCLMSMALLYSHIYLEWYKFIHHCLNTDLVDIEKYYMRRKHSHMLVAKCKGAVVGMVGVVHTENHKQGVVELQRMSVSSTFRRRGVAQKLVQEVVRFTKQQGVEKITLSTTSAQIAAIKLYRKCGFELAMVFPYPSPFLRDLTFKVFEINV